MKAAIYHGVHDTTIEDLDMPEVGPKDVLVKNVMAGICGTDMTAWNYDGPAVAIFPGSEWGHEFAGIVDAVGAEVTDVEVGERVWVNPSTAKRELGVRCDTCGAFSEYVLVEDAKWNYNIYKLPDNVTFKEAALIEPYCVGTAGKNAVGTKETDNVVIYGDGTIGLCALSALVAQGVKNVVVIGLIKSRLDLAMKMGALAVCNSKERDVKEFLHETFGDWGDVTNVDVWIDAVGVPPAVNDFINYSKPNAKLSVVGVHKAPMEIPLVMVLAKKLTIVGSCAYEHEDIVEVIDALASKRTPIESIVTQVYPHEKLIEAFGQAGDLDNAIKVLIDYGVE